MAITTDVIELSRRFIDAFNERDLETIRALIADNMEFRNPQGGRNLYGPDGAAEVLTAAEDVKLRVVREGGEEVEEIDGGVRVTVPVTEYIGDDELHTTAELEVRDGRISAFEIIPPD